MAFFDTTNLTEIFIVRLTDNMQKDSVIGITESLKDAYRLASNYIDCTDEGEQFDLSVKDLKKIFKTGKDYQHISSKMTTNDWFIEDHKDLDRFKYYFTIVKSSTIGISVRKRG